MALSTLLLFPHPTLPFPQFQQTQKTSVLNNWSRQKIRPSHQSHPKMFPALVKAFSAPELGGGFQQAVSLIQSNPPTWQSALLSNLVIFVVGSPLLVSGLSLSGIGAAFLLGILTWRGFGPSGFFLVAAYFVIVSRELHWDLCLGVLNYVEFVI